MSRKRPRLGAEPLGLRRLRGGGPAEADPPRGAADTRELGDGAPPGSSPRPGSARAAVAELGRLFPRGLFEDALPPIALRSQVYSLVPDRTVADRQLVRARRRLAGFRSAGLRLARPGPGDAPALKSTRSGERARSPKGEREALGTHWHEIRGIWNMDFSYTLLAGCYSRFLLSFPWSVSPLAYQC